MQNFSDVAYDNLLRDAAPTYTGAVTVGREPLNAVDWRDFTTFDPGDTAAAKIFAVVCAVSRSMDSFYVYVDMQPGAPVATLQLQYESSVGVFTTLGTIAPAASGMYFAGFGAVPVLAGRKVQVRISGTSGIDGFQIRQLFAGPRVTFPIGQWDGLAPHALTGGVVVENVISMNGSVLARNVRRVEKSGTISLEYLDPAWVRSTWDPFIRHCQRYPFFYRWSPSDYPTDIALCAADSISPPTNMQPAPLMVAKLPYKCITA